MNLSGFCLFIYLFIYLLTYLCLVFFLGFWDRLLLCSPYWSQTCDPFTLVSWILGLQMCATLCLAYYPLFLCLGFSSLTNGCCFKTKQRCLVWAYHSLCIILLSGPRKCSVFILHFPALALELASSLVSIVARFREGMFAYIPLSTHTYSVAPFQIYNFSS
jgi:hypothetical protein